MINQRHIELLRRGLGITEYQRVGIPPLLVEMVEAGLVATKRMGGVVDMDRVVSQLYLDWAWMHFGQPVDEDGHVLGAGLVLMCDEHDKVGRPKREKPIAENAEESKPEDENPWSFVPQGSELLIDDAGDSVVGTFVELHKTKKNHIVCLVNGKRRVFGVDFVSLAEYAKV
jgi:hypothetical protein